MLLKNTHLKLIKPCRRDDDNNYLWIFKVTRSHRVRCISLFADRRNRITITPNEDRQQFIRSSSYKWTVQFCIADRDLAWVDWFCSRRRRLCSGNLIILFSWAPRLAGIASTDRCTVFVTLRSSVPYSCSCEGELGWRSLACFTLCVN